MNKHGFLKVAAAIPFTAVAGVMHNAEQIIAMSIEASYKAASVIVFPELSLTSYTCGDLFLQSDLLRQVEDGLSLILEKTSQLPSLIIIGMPVACNNLLFNCACVLNRGRILGLVPKTYVPGYKEFYEPRWFASSSSLTADSIVVCGQRVPFGTNLLFQDRFNPKMILAIEICEDLWVPIPPSCHHVLAGATVIANLSASNILAGKKEYRTELVKNQSARCICGYIYCSAGMGESTTDVVFDADAIIAENASVLAESVRFIRKEQIIYSEIDVEKMVSERLKMNTFQNSAQPYTCIPYESSSHEFELTRFIDPHPFVPSDKARFDVRCNEIFNIQAAGLAKRIESIPNCKAVIGISGGLDSTLALLVVSHAFKILKRSPADIITLTMPGFGTTDRTYNNAVTLCKSLGTSFREISIREISNTMFDKIGLETGKYNITYENIQARARTYLLMSVANEENGIVIGTGDLSEIALGWSTYNGDHISMYNVNSSIPKTLVKFLVNWVAENQMEQEIRATLHDITEQPISPELLPSDGKEMSQLTEDKIGPYELHDFYLFHFVRNGFSFKKILYLAELAFKDKYDVETIEKWLRMFFKRFFQNQWKRDCVPGGVKVGSIDLSPRGSWRMPAEAWVADFIQ